MRTFGAVAARVLGALVATVMAAFLFGGVATAAVDGSSVPNGAIEVGGDSQPAIEVGGDGLPAIEVGGDDADIDLIPAISEERSPEEALADGGGDSAEPVSSAGVGGSSPIGWILGGAVVLIGGAFFLVRSRKSSSAQG